MANPFVHVELATTGRPFRVLSILLPPAQERQDLCNQEELIVISLNSVKD